MTNAETNPDPADTPQLRARVPWPFGGVVRPRAISRSEGDIEVLAMNTFSGTRPRRRWTRQPIGGGDDAVLVALVLRSVMRGVDADTLRRHWPGSDEGFEVVLRLTGHPS